MRTRAVREISNRAFAAVWMFAALAVICGAAAWGSSSEPGSTKADASKGRVPPPVERVKPLPEFDNGIAARHPGDAGIAGDSAVLFAEDFEEASLDEVVKRWTNVSNKGGEVLSLSTDVAPACRGRQSLRMTATRGRNAGGHLWKLVDPGVDVMHARVYVKFAADHPYVHHFVKIGAWRESPEWPQGEAGYRPDGSRSFQTGLEPTSQWGRHAPPGAWFLYTYWCEMRSYQGPPGRAFYGNAFLPSPPEQAPRGVWQCIELMVKANSAPERHDGEQAFWIDGRLAGRWAPQTPPGRWVKDSYVPDEKGKPFEGFRWRSDDSLKINTFWLLYYMKGVFDGKAQFRVRPGIEVNENVTRVWFDNVVVATGYIGPVYTGTRAAVESTAAPIVESTGAGVAVESTETAGGVKPEAGGAVQSTDAR